MDDQRNVAGWGSCSVDALPYLGPRPRLLAAGDLMVDRSFRWSDCGRSVFRGPPRWAWVPRSLLELAARFEPTVSVLLQEKRRGAGRMEPAGVTGHPHRTQTRF